MLLVFGKKIVILQKIYFLEKPKKVTIDVSPVLLASFRRTTGRNWRNSLSNGVDTWLRNAITN